MASVDPIGRQSTLGLRDIVRLVEDDLARVEEARTAVPALRHDRSFAPPASDRLRLAGE